MSPSTTEKMKGAGFGLLFASIGAGIMLMVWVDPEGARAPIWVVQAAASTFLFAGLSAAAQSFGLKLLANLLALMVAYALAAPGLWMLFDGQGAACSVSVPLAEMALGGGTSWLCRGVFGFGGLLTLVFAIVFTWAAIKRHRAAASGKMEPPSAI